MAYIEKRTTKAGVARYRALVRLKGSPSRSATFARQVEARKWVRQTEASIRARRQFDATEARRPGGAELVDAYAREILPPPPWPTASEYVLGSQVGHILRRAHQRASAIFNAKFSEIELTPRQFAALSKIKDDGEVSQNKLGRLTAMDPATMQGVIGRLKKRGLIVSKADPTDRRRTLWRLTREGNGLVTRAIPAGVETTAATLAPLDAWERLIFLYLLGRLS